MILPVCPSHTFPSGILSAVSILIRETLDNITASHLGLLEGFEGKNIFPFQIKKHYQFGCCGLTWHIVIEQENKLPKDLLAHLAEVISKSRGRWCQGDSALLQGV